MGGGGLQGSQSARVDDRLRFQRQRHATGARVPAPVGGSVQSRPEELRRPPFPPARRAPRPDPRHDPAPARDGLLGRNRDAPHPRLQRLARRALAVDVVHRQRVARHTLARHGVSPRLQDDRPRKHDRGDAARRSGHRPDERAAVRLCRQPARRGRRPGRHPVRVVRRDAHRPLRLSHSRVPAHEGRPMPLLCRDMPSLVRMIAAKPGLNDLALTTNGVLLADQVDALKSAGLGRITVSLDTLHPDRFIRLTRFDQLDAVHAGIAAARRAFGRLKIDTVVIRGVNDDELVPLIEYGRSVNGEIRFIEYMDVGGASRWSPDRVVSRQDMLDALARHYGVIAPIAEPGSAPAERFALGDGTTFGIIASTTAPFCSTCDRSRLTADGMWYLCLYATRGLDLRAPLRAGASSGELKALIAGGWRARDDHGAEDRLALGDQRAFVPVQDLLRKDPHLEMHTRGG